MAGSRARAVLFGESPPGTGRVLGFAVVASVALYLGLVAGVGVLDRWAPFLGSPFVFALVPLGLSTAVAARNGGLLGSLAMAVGPSISYLLLHLAYATEPTLVERLVASGRTGILVGVPLGVVGFLLGVGIRRLGPRFRERAVVSGRAD